MLLCGFPCTVDLQIRKCMFMSPLPLLIRTAVSESYTSQGEARLAGTLQDPRKGLQARRWEQHIPKSCTFFLESLGPSLHMRDNKGVLMEAWSPRALWLSSLGHSSILSEINGDEFSCLSSLGLYPIISVLHIKYIMFRFYTYNVHSYRIIYYIYKLYT